MQIDDMELMESVELHGGKLSPRNGTRHYTIGRAHLVAVVQDFTQRAKDERQKQIISIVENARLDAFCTHYHRQQAEMVRTDILNAIKNERSA